MSREVNDLCYKYDKMNMAAEAKKDEAKDETKEETKEDADKNDDSEK